MPFPEGLGWLGPRGRELQETYRRLRPDHDPIPTFELTLLEVLDESDYERVQSFFDGERDGVYGAGAGELGRRQLQAQLESAAREADARRVSERSRSLETHGVTGEWGDWAAYGPRLHEHVPSEARVHEDPAGRRRTTRIIVWAIMILVLIGWLILAITGAGGNCDSNCDAGGLGSKPSVDRPRFVSSTSGSSDRTKTSGSVTVSVA
jgi:hypothetical protein